MTNLKNKILASALIALVCICGQVQAQRVSISKIDIEEAHLAAAVVGLSAAIEKSYDRRFVAYFVDNYPVANRQTDDITAMYAAAIRHDFIINASFEMLLAGWIAKQDIKLESENITTTIQIVALSEYYYQAFRETHNYNSDPPSDVCLQIDNYRLIVRELHHKNKISSELKEELYSAIRELYKFCYSNLYYHSLPFVLGAIVPFSLSILAFHTHLPDVLRPEEIHGTHRNNWYLNKPEILKRLIKDAETALVICSGIYAERLESVRRVIKKRNAKWQKRIFELQKAALLSVTTLDKITFSE